jgi:hypothetical protein
MHRPSIVTTKRLRLDRSQKFVSLLVPDEALQTSQTQSIRLIDHDNSSNVSFITGILARANQA